MANNETVFLNSANSCCIDQIDATVEVNRDMQLVDDKDADQKELIPRDYQVTATFMTSKWFQTLEIPRDT